MVVMTISNRYIPRRNKNIFTRQVFLRKNVLVILSLILGFLSFSIVIITYYGQNAGNFVMKIDEDAYEKGIILSTTEDFYVETPRLVTDSLNNVEPVTYKWLKIEEAAMANGNYKDPVDRNTYVAYTFYIRNNGFETLDLNMNFRIEGIEKNVDDAVRVMIIDNGIPTIYKKSEVYDAEYYNNMNHAFDSTYGDYPPTEDFASKNMVVSKLYRDFKVNDKRKYTIIVWLEGFDPHCDDEIRGGSIKFSMDFSTVGES